MPTPPASWYYYAADEAAVLKTLKWAREKAGLYHLFIEEDKGDLGRCLATVHREGREWWIWVYNTAGVRPGSSRHKTLRIAQAAAEKKCKKSQLLKSNSHCGLG